MIGLVGIGAMKLSSTMNKTVTTTGGNAEIITIISEIKAILANPKSCTKTLGGLSPVITPPGKIKTLDRWIIRPNLPFPIDYDDDNNYIIQENFIANADRNNKGKGSRYGQGNIKIFDYYLSDEHDEVNADPSSNGDTTHLYINFYRGVGSHNSEVTKKIKIYFEYDSNGKIATCRSLGAEDQIWNRVENNQQNIFYSGGNVGVGTQNPQSNLDISGLTNTTNINVEESLKTKNAEVTENLKVKFAEIENAVISKPSTELVKSLKPVFAEWFNENFNVYAKTGGTSDSEAVACCNSGDLRMACTGSRHGGLKDTHDEESGGLIGTLPSSGNCCITTSDIDDGSRPVSVAFCLHLGNKKNLPKDTEGNIINLSNNDLTDTKKYIEKGSSKIGSKEDSIPPPPPEYKLVQCSGVCTSMDCGSGWELKDSGINTGTVYIALCMKK